MDHWGAAGRADWYFEWSPDRFYEQEVLICGTLVGAWVTQL